jgi:mevalonate kinase
MNSEKKFIFHAKILLIGEYSIIYGGKALTIPLKKYSALLDFPANPDQESEISNKNLVAWHTYLLDEKLRQQYFFPLDLERMKHDLSRGLYFKSEIPQGYGAGSSGALVAAVFNRYGRLPEGEITSLPSHELLRIKKQVALMESWFHGNSSGLDPLSCLAGVPLLVSSADMIEFPPTENLFPGKSYSMFLADTNTTGNTKPLVDWFNKQVTESRLDSELLKDLNNAALDALLQNDSTLFDNYLCQLSLFQLENMTPMVPGNIRNLWKEGLQSQEFTLKLCGSGGGGYLLGFTADYEITKQRFQRQGFSTTLF